MTDGEALTIDRWVRTLAARIAGARASWWCYQDLVQAAWVRILEKWDTYDPGASTLHTWVNRVGAWAMIDEMRHLYTGSRKLRNGGLHDSVDGDELPSADDVEANVLRLETPAAVRELIGQLQPREADIVLARMHGVKLKDWGACSESRACQIHTRALRKMREGLVA